MKRLPGLFAIGGCIYDITIVQQNIGYELADNRVVFRNENSWRENPFGRI
jgi:hypothetical protein